MLNFIFGGSGSGKSTLVSERILSDLRDNKKVILIVPEQQTLSYERIYTKLTEGRSALDLEIMNFSRISDAIFRRFGGLSYNYINGGARLLLMWKTLESLSPSLTQFRRITLSDSAFISRMLSTISELKNCAVTPTALNEAAQMSREENPSLSGKLSDLALIYSAYDQLLKSGYDDPADDLTRLCEKLSEHNFFGGINVYIDSFTGFSAVEYEVLAQIMKQSEQMTVSLCISDAPQTDRRSSKADLFGEARETVARLRRIARKNGVQEGDVFTLESGKRFANEELKLLESNLFRFGSAVCCKEDRCEHISVLRAQDDFDCARMIAQTILKRVINDGLHFSDFAVVARDAEKYRGIIDSAFERSGIPYFMSQKEKLTDKPIFRLIMAALGVVSSGWQLRDVITYIKTGFTGLTPDECCVLENYAASWRISGKRWTDGVLWTMNPYGYTDVVNERTHAILSEVNELKVRLAQPLERLCDSLSGKCSVKDACTALYRYLCEIGVSDMIDGELCDAASWNAVLEVLDQTVSVMPELEVDADSFRRMLAMSMGSADIGRLPHGMDEVVIGSAPMLRADNIKDVFIIGVNDGEFPGTNEASGIFSLRDLEILARTGVDLGFDREIALDAELFFFYRAATAASENVTFFHTALDSAGAEKRSSYFCEHIKKLFPSCITESSSLPEDTVWCYREAVETAAIHPQSAAGEALRRIYKGDAEIYSRLCMADMPISSEDDRVSAKTASELFGGNLTMSQSRLECYEKCAFSYYCKYILKLAEETQPDFTGRDIGSFTHHLLESFMRESAQGGFADISEEEIRSSIERIASGYIAAVCGGQTELSARLTELFSRLCRSSVSIAADILSEIKQSGFKPEYFELPIGYSSEDGVPAMAIPIGDGTSANVIGRIDRVDTYEKDGTLYVRVVDYKTNTKKFSLDNISKGLDMQLLLYLFSIWKDPKKRLLAEREADRILPAGIMYYNARVSDVMLTGGYGKDSEDTETAAHIERSGLFLSDEAILRAMEEKLEGRFIPVKAKSGGFTASSRIKSEEEFEALMHQMKATVGRICSDMKSGNAKADDGSERDIDSCQYCGMRPICRKRRTQ